MRILKAAVAVLLPVVLVACGAAPAEPAAPLATQGAALTQTSPEGCSFALLTRSRPGGFPPLTEIVLTRESTAACVAGGGSVVLGPSYNGSALSLLVTPQGVAVGFTSKATPSGSAAVSVQLRHLDAQTLSVVRAASLGALNPSSAGSVHEGELALLPDGTSLEVRGTKSGTIPGETGEGEQYRATWPDFFTSTTPPSIVAY